MIELQPELRAFIGHLMPFAEVRKDILQEVNLLVWEKRDSFQPGTNLRAWVFRFARNVTMNHQKRARREKEVMFAPETIAALAADFERADPSIDARMPALRRCLEKVPDDERRLLLQRYGRHGAVQEAAEAAGCTAASLRGVLFRLRVALRRCVERELNREGRGSA